MVNGRLKSARIKNRSKKKKKNCSIETKKNGKSRRQSKIFKEEMEYLCN